MSSPNQEKRWNSWGYPEQVLVMKPILGGAKPFVRSSTLERDTAMLVIEAELTDRLNMTFDALYVDFSDEKIYAVSKCICMGSRNSMNLHLLIRKWFHHKCSNRS